MFRLWICYIQEGTWQGKKARRPGVGPRAEFYRVARLTVVSLSDVTAAFVCRALVNAINVVCDSTLWQRKLCALCPAGAMADKQIWNGKSVPHDVVVVAKPFFERRHGLSLIHI